MALLPKGLLIRRGDATAVILSVPAEYFLYFKIVTVVKFFSYIYILYKILVQLYKITIYISNLLAIKKLQHI